MTVRILTGDCRDILSTLPEQSVQTCVTSPPYWNLRDYNVAGQIGLEATLDEYVETMVAVFREVRRVLRDDGTLWLNLGDAYAANRTYQVTDNKHRDVGNSAPMKVPTGMKSKDLIGLPWLIAFALRADGWYLRSDIIWNKPNPMPESVRDRPTSAHEHIFLLTKRPRYFYDADAIAEPSVSDHDSGNGYARPEHVSRGGRGQQSGWTLSGNPTRNLRNVWTIATHAFSEAHFATFPPELAETCIKAGTSEKGCCASCGAPWLRMTEVFVKAGLVPRLDEQRFKCGSGPHPSSVRAERGWAPSCSCDADVRPCKVLDIFGGSGTVGLVADRLGRDADLIELNPDYIAIGQRRITNDAPLFANVEIA